MKGKQEARLSALHGIRKFMDDHADALGPVNQSASRAALDDVLTEIEQGAAAQDSAETNATSGTQEKNELRDELRQKHMAPIAAIARATLAHTPRIAKLRLPGARVSDRSLIAAATSIGARRLLRLPTTLTTAVRLRITQAAACPALSELSLWFEN